MAALDAQRAVGIGDRRATVGGDGRRGRPENRQECEEGDRARCRDQRANYELKLPGECRINREDWTTKAAALFPGLFGFGQIAVYEVWRSQHKFRWRQPGNIGALQLGPTPRARDMRDLVHLAGNV